MAVGDGLVLGKLATVVVDDGAACSSRHSAQFCGDGICGEVGVFAEKTPDERQPGAALLQRQENVALAAEVHEGECQELCVFAAGPVPI